MSVDRGRAATDRPADPGSWGRDGSAGSDAALAEQAEGRRAVLVAAVLLVLLAVLVLLVVVVLAGVNLWFDEPVEPSPTVTTSIVW